MSYNGIPIRCLFLISALFSAICTTEGQEKIHPIDLISADAAICLQIPNLHRNLQRLKDSDLAQHIERLSFYQEWLNSGDVKQAREDRKQLEQQTGRSVEQLIEDLFGTSVVIAAMVHEDSPAEVNNLVITEIKNNESLKIVLELWQKSDGHQIRKKRHSARPYVQHLPVKGPAGEAVFHVQLGDLFAFSNSEQEIQRVIDLYSRDDDVAAPASQNSLASQPRFQVASRNLSDEGLLHIHVNPRKWTRTLKTYFQKQAEGNPDFDFDTRQFDAIWSHLHWLRAEVRADAELVVDLKVDFDGRQFGHQFAKTMEATRGEADFVAKIPRNAFAFIAGRQNASAWSEWTPATAAEQQTLNQIKAVSSGVLLGLDLFDDVLPAFGPNWCGYVVPREDFATSAIPVDGLLAFELMPEKDHTGKNSKPMARKAIQNALRFGMNLLVATTSKPQVNPPPIVKPYHRDGLHGYSIENLGPCQPSFAISDHYLMLASSQELIDEFVQDDKNATLATTPAFRRLKTGPLNQMNQILFLNIEQLRGFLIEHQESVLSNAKPGDESDQSAHKERFIRLMEMMSVFDGMFVAANADVDSARIVIGASIAPDSETSSQN